MSSGIYRQIVEKSLSHHFLPSGLTSLFPLIISILIKAETTQHNEVTDYEDISIEFGYDVPVPIQGYTSNLKEYKVYY
jgi:hypothetical protein